MEHKKDIGTLFKEKLQNNETKTKSGLWEKVDASLTQRAKKRRKAYWSWGIATGVLVTTGIVLTIVFSENNNKPTQQANPLTTEVENNLNNYKKPAVSKLDSIKNDSKTDIKEASIEIDSTQKKLPETAIDNISENSEENISTIEEKKARKLKAKHIEKSFDSFRKKTVYRYYNSHDSTMIETTNKALIDSLTRLEKTEKIHDSVK
ncbi:MAG: hypothetical protein CMC07_05705 [Flavobacteriaceae bacterium]|nr:hypothetical protein [Flavobacteriaceae bacterium]